MPDSQAIAPEHRLQGRFRFAPIAAALLLLSCILLFDTWIAGLPDRAELGRRTAKISFERLHLSGFGSRDLRLAGAWRVTSRDPRFGGISALAAESGNFIALNDGGVLIRFAPPRGLAGDALIDELPTGPGEGTQKLQRDSEALVADPKGRGWWVAFENANELWLYDRSFTTALGRRKLPGRWRTNRGVEGAAALSDGTVLLFPEDGRSIIELSASGLTRTPFSGFRGRVADAAADGQRVLAIEQSVGLTGFSNRIAVIERRGGRYVVTKRIPLPLGGLANVEAIVVEPRSDGRRRLWLMTDDNHQPPLRTLLVAIDLAAADR